jgi:hypothetical protein
MKTVSALFLLLALSSIPSFAASASATVPATQASVVPAVSPLPFALPSPVASTASDCIVEECFILYPEMYCTCEWVYCRGLVHCGILHEVGGSAGASSASCGSNAPAFIAPTATSAPMRTKPSR